MTHFVQPAKYFPIGTIQKPKGLKGEMIARLDYPDIPLSPKLLFFQLEHCYVPYKVATWDNGDTHGMISLEAIQEPNAATKLQGLTIFVDADSIEPLLGKSHLRFIGYTVKDSKLGPLGKVLQIEESGPQVLLCIDYHEQKLHIPIHNNFIKEEDAEKKVLITSLPSGYIEGVGLKKHP